MEGKNTLANIIVLTAAIITFILVYTVTERLTGHREAKEVTIDQPSAYNVDICGLEAVECPGEAKSIEAIISEAAARHGVSAELMIDLARCESSLDPKRIGDGFMPKPSMGLFQISLYYHPDVTAEQALDPVFASEWTAKQISAGRLHLWTCSRYIAKR